MLTIINKYINIFQKMKLKVKILLNNIENSCRPVCAKCRMQFSINGLIRTTVRITGP